MNSQKIDELIESSYKHLDKKKVDKIASHINTQDLKKYINGLKLAEKENTVIVSTASPLNNKDLKEIMKLFPNKKIVLEKDPSLMLGVRIVNNDIVYDFTLKNSLHKILSYVEQNYD